MSSGRSKIDSELPTLLQNESDMKKMENSDHVVGFSGGSNYGIVANTVEFVRH